MTQRKISRMQRVKDKNRSIFNLKVFYCHRNSTSTLQSPTYLSMKDESVLCAENFKKKFSKAFHKLVALCFKVSWASFESYATFFRFLQFVLRLTL